MIVNLSVEEMKVAALAGIERRLQAIERGRGHRFGLVTGNGDWDRDIEAVAAEMAVAKAINHYWAPYGAPDSHGDIGTGIQVRSTKRPDGSLIVHETDSDTHVFYLVCGQMPTFNVVGSISGRAAKQPRYWRTGVRHPAFFVPQEQLVPLTGQESRAA